MYAACYISVQRRFKIISYQHANCASVIFTDYTSPRRDTIDLQIHRHAIRSITYEGIF